MVVFSYYQEIEVEAESQDEAEMKMFDAFQLHNADSESNVFDVVEIKPEGVTK
jgi:hypothetical protein